MSEILMEEKWRSAEVFISKGKHLEAFNILESLVFDMRPNHVFFERIVKSILICGYYARKIDETANYIDILALTVKDNNIKRFIKLNRKFYIRELKGILSNIECDMSDNEFAMNPSLIKHGDGYTCLVRTVNYIRENAKYTFFSTDRKIRSKCLQIKLDKDLNVIDQTEIDQSSRNVINDHEWNGIEDSRIFKYKGELFCIYTAPDVIGETTSVMGIYNIDKSKWYIIDSPVKGRTEKNWTPLVKDNALYLIYSWEPLVIYTLNLDSLEEGNKLELVEFKRESTNLSLDGFRGGSQFIEYKYNGTRHWLTCVHEVDISDAYIYIHRFILMNENFEIIATSIPFYLKEIDIEFCAGMDYDLDGENILLSFGLKDRQALIKKVKLTDINELLIPIKNNYIYDSLIRKESSKKNCTLVTGYYQIIDKEPNVRRRSMESYFRHFEFIAKMDVPKIVHINERFRTRCIEILDRLSPNKKYKVIGIEDGGLPTEKYRHYGESCKMYDNSSPITGKMDYFLVTTAKQFWLNESSINNPFDTEYFIWMDFGINHIVDLSNFHIDEIIDNIPNEIRICQLMPTALEEIKDYTRFYSVSMGKIAAGVITGDIKYIRKFMDLFIIEIDNMFKNNRICLEEQLIGSMTAKYPWLFSLYYADYPGILCNYDCMKRDQDLILRQINYANNHSMHKEAYNIYVKLEDSIEKGTIRISEDKIMDMLIYGYICSFYFNKINAINLGKFLIYLYKYSWFSYLNIERRKDYVNNLLGFINLSLESESWTEREMLNNFSFNTYRCLL